MGCKVRHITQASMFALLSFITFSAASAADTCFVSTGAPIRTTPFLGRSISMPTAHGVASISMKHTGHGINRGHRNAAFVNPHLKQTLDSFTATMEAARVDESPIVDSKTTLVDLQAMSDDQLRSQITRCQMEQFELRKKSATRQPTKASDFQTLKKKVAQMNTIL